MPLSLLIFPFAQYLEQSKRVESSERVILGRYLVGEELVENGNLLHDVVAYLGYLGEEEEGEEAGYTAETGGEDTVLGGLGEGEAVVVLGDGVSVGSDAVSFSAVEGG